jgi:hypothetical protein
MLPVLDIEFITPYIIIAITKAALEIIRLLLLKTDLPKEGNCIIPALPYADIPSEQ